MGAKECLRNHASPQISGEIYLGWVEERREKPPLSGVEKERRKRHTHREIERYRETHRERKRSRETEREQEQAVMAGTPPVPQ